MILLFPVNGTGQRFIEAGYTIPKPLLPVHGKPLLLHASEMYPMNWQKAFALSWKLPIEIIESLSARYADYLTFIVRVPTSGPLETLLLCDLSAEIDRNEPILIADCDSWLATAEIDHAVRAFDRSACEAGVTVRTVLDSNPGLSYVSLDERGEFVTEAREKEPFTNISSTGPYWFRTLDIFLRYGRQALDMGYTSIAPVFNRIIEAGGKVRAIPVSSFIHLGTPQAYEAYCAQHSPADVRSSRPTP